MNTPHTLSRRSVAGLLALAAALAAPATRAVEASWSGFATLGYARSDSAYTYQRYINDQGTWQRDSLVAGQLDLRLSPQWSATAQVKLAPATDKDDHWRARASWAFVGWRPDNDWLLRAGRLRAPLYLHSESLDVGVSHDMARLPHEMYSISPTNDVDGLSASRSFVIGHRDVGVDAYAGQARTEARFWSRDGVPGATRPGPFFIAIRAKMAGMVLTVRDPSLTWRLGVHAATTRPIGGRSLAKQFPRVDLGPGIGYWQVDDAFPGPGVPRTSRVRNLILTGGLEWQLGEGWRVAGEFVRMRQRDTELGSDSLGGYVALFKRFGDFTPYVSLARQQSSDEIRGWYTRLTSGGLPSQLPGAAQINGAQRQAAEGLYAFDQRSLAVGLSYALSPTARVKTEWMRTRVGEMSNHFDTPPGLPDPRGLKVDTLTMNLNVAF